MVMEVLQNQTQIVRARNQLIDKGVSQIDSAWRRLFRRFGILGGIKLGDQQKSWDVLETLEFLEKNIKRDDAILDIGSFASEILPVLHKSGFTDLTGVDLNADLYKMPFSDHIRYEIADFMHTQFESETFRAVTSISVIEHGFNEDGLLQEMSRLLRSGGYFVASFDYWPEKIDTTGIRYFGLDWIIFSKADIARFIQMAESYGLHPVGELRYEADIPAIECGGKMYTFGWLALQKR